jgi:hypothetical protein
LVQGIGATLGSLPDFIEPGVGFRWILALKFESRDRDQGWKFKFYYIDGACPDKRMVESLIGVREVMHPESSLTLPQRGPDEIPLIFEMRR